MFDRIERALAELKAVVAELEPTRLQTTDAARMVELFAQGERICTAGRVLVAVRAEESGAWRAEGYSSAAAWMAAKTGSSMSAAFSSLDAACRLDELPATEAALRAGKLSGAQLCELSAAASASPAAEDHLLRTAAVRPLSGLRAECQRVRAAARPDESAVAARIHRSRHLRRWADPEGAFCFGGRTTNEVGAGFWAAIEAEADALFEAARGEGRREPTEAYLLDAVVNLVTGESSGAAPKAVNVMVDHAAWARGRTEEGELCEISGVGPIPVASAQAMAGDAFVKVLVGDGTDIQRVAHMGRTIPVHVRSALIARDARCVVPGCEVTKGLEIDHWQVPFSEGGSSELWNLCRICHRHHYEKTHCGAILAGGPGGWTWTPPPMAQGLSPPSTA
jgi:hypothetical protein